MDFPKNRCPNFYAGYCIASTRISKRSSGYLITGQIRPCKRRWTNRRRYGSPPAGEYSSQEIALLQHANKYIKQIVLNLQGFSSEVSSHSISEFTLCKGVLFKKNPTSGRPLLLVVKSIIRKYLIKECHDAPDGGHRRVEKTLCRVWQRFWWKGVQSSVWSYVQSCNFCQTFKPRVRLPAGSRPIPPPKEMFHTLGIDHIGPFKKTNRGNQHLIACILPFKMGGGQTRN